MSHVNPLLAWCPYRDCAAASGLKLPRQPRSHGGPLPLRRGLLTWVHSPSAVPPARTTPAPLGAAPLQSLQQPPGGDQQPAAVGKRETGAGERRWPQPASSEDKLPAAG